jgi:hypothetical protein
LLFQISLDSLVALLVLLLLFWIASFSFLLRISFFEQECKSQRCVKRDGLCVLFDLLALSGFHPAPGYFFGSCTHAALPHSSLHPHQKRKERKGSEVVFITRSDRPPLPLLLFKHLHQKKKRVNTPHTQKGKKTPLYFYFYNHNSFFLFSFQQFNVFSLNLAKNPLQRAATQSASLACGEPLSLKGLRPRYYSHFFFSDGWSPLFVFCCCLVQQVPPSMRLLR